MKLPIFVILILCIVRSLPAQETGATNCALNGTVVADGQADEWPMNWMREPDKIFEYNVCADDNNIYVRVRTEEYYVKRKMAAFGFTLWIDPKGKKKRKLGLRFPVGGVEATERAAELRQSERNVQSASERADFQKEVDRKLISDLEVLELIGLTDDPITSTRSGITNGIKVAIGLDAQGSYVYEAIVPFKAYRLSRATISDLTIGFETGKYIPPKVKTSTKVESQRDFTGATQMSRMQGYQSLVGNPKLSYPTDAWVTVKFK